MAAAAAAVMLSGCRAREPEDRAIPQAFEINLEDGRLAGGFGEHMLSGDTVEDIIMANQNRMDRYLDLGHIKVIVLGENLFEEKETLGNVLQELEEQPLIARNSRIVLYDYEQESSYLKQLADEGKDPGEYLCDLYKNNPLRSGDSLTLEELLGEEL